MNHIQSYYLQYTMHCESFIFDVMHGHFFSFREIQILMLNFSLSNHTQLYTISNNQIYIISNNTILTFYHSKLRQCVAPCKNQVNQVFHNAVKSTLQEKKEASF